MLMLAPWIDAADQQVRFGTAEKLVDGQLHAVHRCAVAAQASTPSIRSTRANRKLWMVMVRPWRLGFVRGHHRAPGRKGTFVPPALRMPGAKMPSLADRDQGFVAMAAQRYLSGNVGMWECGNGNVE